MSSDISDYLQPTNSTTRADINKILQALLQIKPPVERDALKTFVAFHPVVRTRTTTVTSGSPNVLDTDNRTRETAYMKKKIPTTVQSYPITHTTTGTFTFPTSGHKLAGNGKYDGSTYITLTDQSRLNVTDEISIALWIKPASASGDGLIFSKDTQYQLKLASSNKIQWRTYSGGAWRTALEYTYTPNTWVHVVATYKSSGSGQKLYINGSLNQSDALTGAMGTSANNAKVGGDGTSNVPANTYMSWLTVLHKEVSSSWITDVYTNTLIDTSGTNTEITTIPFVGDEQPRSNATAGLCLSN